MKTYTIVEHDTGDIISYLDGAVQSIDDQPAVRCGNDPYMFWFDKGKLHRTNGPAAISKSGYEYWLYGKQYTHKEWALLTQMNN